MNQALADAVCQIESHVAALDLALRGRDASALEAATQTLQSALAASIQRFAAAARCAGSVPLPLRRRIGVIGARVAAQRERLVRSSAALERALVVLVPAAQRPVACRARGDIDRPARVACIEA